MAAASGRTASRTRAQRFTLLYPRSFTMEQIESIDILLVEDNAMDAELTMRGLKNQKLANQVTWVKDGELALDYIFRRGVYAERDDNDPRLILLDLKMPRVDGTEVLRTIRADERTR